MTKLTRPMAQYSHARRVGDLIFVAGQGCRDPETDAYAGVTRDAQGKVTAHDIKAQTAGVLQNLERVLAAHGLNRRHVVDVTVFLTDMAEFPGMNEVWNRFFAEGTPPARTTVAVKTLPGDNFVEMKAVATTKEPT